MGFQSFSFPATQLLVDVLCNSVACVTTTANFVIHSLNSLVFNFCVFSFFSHIQWTPIILSPSALYVHARHTSSFVGTKLRKIKFWKWNDISISLPSWKPDCWLMSCLPDECYLVCSRVEYFMCAIKSVQCRKIAASHYVTEILMFVFAVQMPQWEILGVWRWNTHCRFLSLKLAEQEEDKKYRRKKTDDTVIFRQIYPIENFLQERLKKLIKQCTYPNLSLFNGIRIRTKLTCLEFFRIGFELYLIINCKFLRFLSFNLNYELRIE